ncbi:urease accessory protein D [Cannabis sativa]|uniref:urease accessory protein D n=1 Tax=Cannabis sativa TaxID=3483 RepID=UPI0011E005E2|nr:urease accessory protein D [Cannabis sativa]
METGRVVVEKVGGKSTVTSCYSKYPLKFIVPNKVGNSKCDAVWIYSLTYGGGIVSGDSISFKFNVGYGCYAVLTTQASTKVYKSMGSKCSEQVLEARVSGDALLAIIPDPVTCFSTARYTQKQVFRMVGDSSLLMVDWVTSGRHESGEKWDFDMYKSTNNIFIEDDEPLFLDTVLLEKGSISSIAERMQGYQVIAMVVFWGPKMKHIQNKVQEDVRKIMTEQLQFSSPASVHKRKRNPDYCINQPNFIASSSVFGSEGKGVVVRIVAATTESVYQFLRHQLASLEPLLGVLPYN